MKCITAYTQKMGVYLLTNSQTNIEKFLTHPLIPPLEITEGEEEEGGELEEGGERETFYSFPLYCVYIIL